MADVFISYSQQDRSIAEALANDVRASGYDVWWDAHLYAGDDFHDVIREELRAAGAVVVIWSEPAVGSQWARGEAQEALEDGKLIATHVARFDPRRVPLNFRAIHIEDVANVGAIIKAIERKVSHPRAGGAYQEVDLYRIKHDRECLEIFKGDGRVTEQQYAALRERGDWLIRVTEERLRTGYVDDLGLRIRQARLSREGVERELSKVFVRVRGITKEEMERRDTRDRRLAYDVFNSMMMEGSEVHEELQDILQRTVLSDKERYSALRALIEREYSRS